MSGLYRSGLSAPIDAMMFFEFACNGQSETTWFQGLSGGNTSSAEQIASASGVLNITGLVMRGIFAVRIRSSRAGSVFTGLEEASSVTKTPNRTKPATMIITLCIFNLKTSNLFDLLPNRIRRSIIHLFIVYSHPPNISHAWAKAYSPSARFYRTC